jgi:hypothetical protein
MPLGQRKSAIIDADSATDCCQNRQSPRVWFPEQEHPVSTVSSRSLRSLIDSCVNIYIFIEWGRLKMLTPYPAKKPKYSLKIVNWKINSRIHDPTPHTSNGFQSKKWRLKDKMQRQPLTWLAQDLLEFNVIFVVFGGGHTLHRQQEPELVSVCCNVPGRWCWGLMLVLLNLPC